MSYLALTDADRDAMLETIGVASIDELFAELPEGVRFDRELALAAGAGRAGADGVLRGARRRERAA